MRIDKNKARDMLARFDGTGRYADPSNPCVGDGYYGAQIERTFGMTIKQLREVVKR